MHLHYSCHFPRSDWTLGSKLRALRPLFACIKDTGLNRWHHHFLFLPINVKLTASILLGKTRTEQHGRFMKVHEGGREAHNTSWSIKTHLTRFTWRKCWLVLISESTRNILKIFNRSMKSYVTESWNLSSVYIKELWKFPFIQAAHRGHKVAEEH